MNAYLENALNLAEYREAKNKLVNQKQLLKDRLTAFEQKSNNRFELAAKFINTVKKTEIIALQENPEQGRDFLKKIGSNFRLSGQKLFYDLKNPFKILAEAELRLWRGEATIAQNPNSENWRKDRDSNPGGLLHPTCSQSRRTRPLCDPSKTRIYLNKSLMTLFMPLSGLPSDPVKSSNGYAPG